MHINKLEQLQFLSSMHQSRPHMTPLSTLTLHCLMSPQATRSSNKKQAAQQSQEQVQDEGRKLKQDDIQFYWLILKLKSQLLIQITLQINILQTQQKQIPLFHMVLLIGFFGHYSSTLQIISIYLAHLMNKKQFEEGQEEIITASAPDKHIHPDRYKKQEIFSFISNQNLSNFICIPIFGIFWVGGFIYCNQKKISPIELNFARYIVQLISTYLILKLRKQKIDFKDTKDFRLLIIRSTISGLNGLVTALFQMYLPLTVYYTISASTTMFAFILNYFLFGIHVTAHQIKAVICAMIGIGLVINGRAIYQLIDSSYQFKSNFYYSSNDLGVQIFVGVLVVIWSCIWAYGIVITGRHHASFHEFIFINTMVGYFMFSALEIMLPEASQGSVYDLFVRRPDELFSIFIYTGIPLATANYIFNAGIFISTNTGISTILTQINILYVYFICTIRYGQEINYICLFGAALLICSIYHTLFVK